MPKDEVDADDPMELCGAPMCAEDERGMVEAVIDEYVRMGFSPAEVLTLFTSPHYAMTHRIWTQHGEAYVRACIDDVLTRWTTGVH